MSPIVAKAASSVLTGRVFNSILIVGLILLVVSILFNNIPMVWFSVCLVVVGAIGSYVEAVGTAPLKYAVWNFIISFVLFIIVYVYFIKDLPMDAWKFVFIFLASWITGIVGSFSARAISHHWKMKTTVENFLSNVIVSLIYSVILFAGIYAVFFDQLSLERLIIVGILMKLLTWAIASAISKGSTNKLLKSMEHFVTG